MPSIWTPAPLAITHPSLFTSSELNCFEEQILTDPNANEQMASQFFARYPKFLYLGQGDKIRREVILLRGEGKPVQRVDFFRRSYRHRFWDIIEIKDPNKPFVVGQKGQHPRLSADVDKAINQAQDYRDLLDRDSSLRASLLPKGILIGKPQMVVIVGKHNDEVALEVLQTLYDRVRQRGAVDAWSYDDLYEFAKQHYAANTLVVTLTHYILTEEYDDASATAEAVETRDAAHDRETVDLDFVAPVMSDPVLNSLIADFRTTFDTLNEAPKTRTSIHQYSQSLHELSRAVRFRLGPFADPSHAGFLASLLRKAASAIPKDHESLREYRRNIEARAAAIEEIMERNTILPWLEQDATK